MRIHGMMLVRNAEKRWLKNVLFQLKYFCDRIVVLDDASTDNTAFICRTVGCEVHKSNENRWITNEVSARKELWELTIAGAENDDWIICLDADELFVSDHLPYLKFAFNTMENDVDGVGFRLHDMWSDTHYRDDEYWKAHHYMWPLAIRYKADVVYQWQDKALHCGRFAVNSSKRCMPTMIPIKHMGWSTAADRQNKYDQYMRLDPEGKHGILAQYKSILDENPILRLFGGHCNI